MKKVTRILLEETRTNAGILALVVFLTLLIVGFDVISPWPFKILIDDVLSTDPLSSGSLPTFLLAVFPTKTALGFFAIFVYFASTFLQAILEYFKSVLTKVSARRVTSDFARRAFESLQTIAIGFFSKQKIGDYIYRLSYDTSALGELVEEGLLPLTSSALYLALTIGIMLFISIPLTLIALASLPFLASGMYYFNRRIQSATKLSERYNSTMFAFVEQAMTHLKIIQAFSHEEKESEGFDRRIETSLRNEFAVSRLDFLLSLVVGMLIATSYSVVLLYGMQAVFSGALTTGLLIVFIFYLDNLTNPVINSIYATTVLQQAYVKVRRMEEFFSPATHIPYHAGERIPARTDDIRFDHVTYIARDGTRILDDVSFTIEAGKRTVIFGVSGAGKTTIVNLLMRFVDEPRTGTVSIGGYPIAQFDVEALRGAIAYVPQEITLFNDTIRNNILFGQHASEHHLRTVAKIVDADSFIQTLPGGYDFRVGELGGYISGGQRQRLMLARALIKKNASIYLFDETFSALDVKTRHEVLHNVYEYTHGKTVILVSNVFDVIKGADAIVVLNRGKVIYSGPSNHLPREVSLEHLLAQTEPVVVA